METGKGLQFEKLEEAPLGAENQTGPFAEEGDKLL